MEYWMGDTRRIVPRRCLLFACAYHAAVRDLFLCQIMIEALGRTEEKGARKGGKWARVGQNKW
jgi:hypothetical protein